MPVGPFRCFATVKVNSVNEDVSLKKISENYYQNQLDTLDRECCVETIEDQRCAICFNDESKAVLMDCGHGGLCKRCAIFLLTNKKCCYLCRSNIKLVYELSSNTQVKAKIEAISLP